MSQRRHRWYVWVGLVLLLSPLAILMRPVHAAGTYIVTNTLDNLGGDCKATPTNCTLRQAIAAANSDGVASSVTFASSLTGVITLDIVARGPLTLTENNTTIEALLNPPAITQPPIEIAGAGSNQAALTILSSGNTIKGLSITGFTGLDQPQGTGILLTGVAATGNTITDNYIGVKPDGTTVGANTYGIQIVAGASSNTIIANLIMASRASGVLVENASLNTFKSNLIGIGINSIDLANAETGIEITSKDAGLSTGNIIGGIESEGNFISYNGAVASTTDAGILISGVGTTGTVIRSNIIGTDITGTLDCGNHGDGIRIEAGASGTSIIGVTGDPVVIGGNDGYGIHIMGAGTANNQITGNVLVGVNKHQNGMVGNTLGGVKVDLSATGTTLNGSALDPLLIGGNSGPGVTVLGATTLRTQVLNAYIGVAPNILDGSTRTFPNGAGGVMVRDAAQHVTISGNTISGNQVFGIQLNATNTVTITNNFIGLDVARTGIVPNVGPGIDVQAGTTNTLIGGGSSAANYLAGNTGSAIAIAGAGTLNTTVRYNVIGVVKDTDNLYKAAAGNAAHGILVTDGAQQTMLARNTIASNGGSGVRIAGTGTMTVTLDANRVGLVQSGGTVYDRPNQVSGIVLEDVKDVDLISNLVGYNVGNGIAATNVQTVTLRSNQASMQGSGNGILIAGTSSDVQIYSNTLSFNADFGILVQGNSQRIRMQYNRVTQNTDGGVRLDGTTTSTGTPPDDLLTLPNHGIDPPIVNPASLLNFRIDQNGLFSGWIYTDTATLPASACTPATLCQIQFFRPGQTDVGVYVSDGQGFTAFKVLPVDGTTTSDFAYPNAQGFFSGRLSLNVGEVLPPQVIVAVTDTNGNTSEFGSVSLNPTFDIVFVDPPTGQLNAVPNETITYNLRIANNGNVDLTNLNVVTSSTLARWSITPQNGASNLFTIPAGTTKDFTVVMKLPTGTDANAQPGTQDRTIVTATTQGRLATVVSKNVTLTTTVQALPVITATMLNGTGTAPPNGHVVHTHRFTNSGNATVILDLTAETIDPASSGYVWNTALSTTMLEIPPGQSKTVDVTITIPAGAQTYDANGNLLQVRTTVTATARAPYSIVVETAEGITGVDLVSRVQMTGNGQFEQAASAAEISFFHSVLNTSNGPARFCLNYRANSRSMVIAFSSQNDVAITQPGNCFQLDGPNGVKPLLRFKALIKVTDILLPGDLESIDIYLTDATTGKEIPNALVTDDIEITVSPILPRLWIPLIIH